MDALNQLLLGALGMASWVAGVFFLRFWRQSRDRLFLFFFLAFWLLAVNWLAIAFFAGSPGNHHEVQLVRLAAFTMIIAGVVDKNRRVHAKRR